MNREIKFRAWDKENQIMIYPESKNNADTSIDYTINAWCDSESERSILTQYTGLKDKNGKEIYEGDIVKFGHSIPALGENLGLIPDGDFKEAQGEVFITPVGVQIGEDFLIDMLQHLQESLESDNIEEFEIIGSVFENPELLEVN